MPTKSLLTSAVEFFQKNQLCWKKTTRKNKDFFVLALQTGENASSAIRATILVGDKIAHLHLGTSRPKDVDTILGYTAYLTMGSYDVLFTTDGAPVLLEGMNEYAELLQSRGIDPKTWKTYETLQTGATEVERMGKADIPESEENDD